MIHELIHLLIPDHSKEFYRLLYKYCPNYSLILRYFCSKVPDYRNYNFYINREYEIFENVYDYNKYCEQKNINKEIM